MLKAMSAFSNSDISVQFKDAVFPSPFSGGIEYSAPARGMWNIVHTGMLIPQSHQIFVCAQGCLRGVVLTAAEMGASERFSTIAVRENNIIESDMESLIINGVVDIIEKLTAKNKRPKAVLVYTSCLHHFLGSDLHFIYETLNNRFDDISFIDCYMNPIMRKSGITPDELMRRQLYGLLKSCKKDEKSISIIGNNFATEQTSELVSLITKSGCKLQDITLCKSYDEYLQMAKSARCITYNPAAIKAGNALEQRINQKHLYLPLSFDYNEITANLYALCDELKIEKPDYTENINCAENKLLQLKEEIGNTAIYIDYTATMRPLSLARLLLNHGFNVKRIYADGFTADEKGDFEKLKTDYPKLEIFPTIDAKMRLADRKSNEKIIAIGQKAAYFSGSNNFVNIVENGGMYGFSGICKMANLIADAYKNEKDAKSLIQIKGLGCEQCV